MAFSNKYYVFVTSFILACAVVFVPKGSLLLFCGWAAIYFFQSPISSFRGIFLSPLIIPIFLFFAWAVLSATWSLDSSYALKSTGGGLALALVALGMGTFLPTLPDRNKDFIIRLFCSVFWIALAVWAIELISQGFFFETITALKGKGPKNYGVEVAYKPTAFVMGGLSLLLVGWYFFLKQYVRSTVLFIFTCILCTASYSTTSVLGYVIGGGVFLLGLVYPRVLGWAMLTLILGLNAAIPILVYLLPISNYGLKLYEQLGHGAASFYHRTVIWEFSLTKWLENPIIGWGAASSGKIPGGEEEIFEGGRVLSLHSHNHLLQSGLELGLIGMLLYTLILGYILWVIHSRLKSAAARATAFGLFAAVYVFCSSEHSLWHHWWMAWLGLFASLGIVICSRIETSQS